VIAARRRRADAKIKVDPATRCPSPKKSATANIPRAVGFITDPKQADDIVRGGKADVVLLARQMLWIRIGRPRRKALDTSCRRESIRARV